MSDNTRPNEPLQGELIDPNRAGLSPQFAAALVKAGVQPTAVHVPQLVEYEAVTLEELCTEPTHVKNGEGQSPLLVVVTYQEFPEWDDFDDYVGGIRCECVTEHGDNIAFTHYLTKKDSGEYSPVAQYCKEATVPFALKMARIRTRKPNQFVIRPIAAVLAAE